MQKCDLSYSQFQTYLNLLTDLKFLIGTDGVYTILDKGQNYVKAFQDLENFLTLRSELGQIAGPEI